MTTKWIALIHNSWIWDGKWEADRATEDSMRTRIFDNCLRIEFMRRYTKDVGYGRMGSSSISPSMFSAWISSYLESINCLIQYPFFSQSVLILIYPDANNLPPLFCTANPASSSRSNPFHDFRKM